MSKLPRATHEGVIVLAGGRVNISCAVLTDGRRLITSRAMMAALGRPWKGSYKRTELPNFLAAKNIKPFIDNDLLDVLQAVDFIGMYSRRVNGYLAELLPRVCDVYLAARDADALTDSQKPTAANAEILMRGLAHVGIAALIDEATGYQEIRDRKALNKILDKYLLAEQAKWAKRFPDEFYQEIFRLRGWPWQGMKVNRPQVVGRYTNDFVWDRLAPGVREELERINPKTETGRRRAMHHQWLTYDVGHPALQKHLTGVIALMRGSGEVGSFSADLAACLSEDQYESRPSP